MNAAARLQRDAIQAFVGGYTDKAKAVDITGLDRQVARAFPAAAPIDRTMLQRMLRALGFVGSLNPEDRPGIWRRAIRPEEVPF